jgi:hypothetical protein
MSVERLRQWRAWRLGHGHLFVEPAEGHGQPFYVDDLGRIGVVRESDGVTFWLKATPEGELVCVARTPRS